MSRPAVDPHVYGHRGQAMSVDATAAGLERFRNQRRQRKLDGALRAARAQPGGPASVLAAELSERDEEVHRLRVQLGRLRLQVAHLGKDNDALRRAVSCGAVRGWSINPHGRLILEPTPQPEGITL